MIRDCTAIPSAIGNGQPAACTRILGPLPVPSRRPCRRPSHDARRTLELLAGVKKGEVSCVGLCRSCAGVRVAAVLPWMAAAGGGGR